MPVKPRIPLTVEFPAHIGHDQSDMPDFLMIIKFSEVFQIHIVLGQGYQEISTAQSCHYSHKLRNRICPSRFSVIFVLHVTSGQGIPFNHILVFNFKAILYCFNIQEIVHMTSPLIVLTRCFIDGSLTALAKT